MNSDVIITCAVTGDDTKVTKSPHCPITPEQIAASAVEAARAGAAIVHIHVRDPETGQFSMATRHYREVVKRIRESRVDVLVNLTCGMGGYICVGPQGLADTPAPGTDFVSQEDRMRHVIELCAEGLYRPEIATLDCGTLNFGDGNRAYVSTPDYCRQGADRGSGPGAHQAALTWQAYASTRPRFSRSGSTTTVTCGMPITR